MHGVTVQRANAFNLPVIVKLGARLFGLFSQLLHAQQILFFPVCKGRALVLGVIKALVGVDHIRRCQLPFLASKGRVVRIKNAGLELDGVGTEIITDDGQRDCQAGLDFDRTRQVVVPIQTVKNVGGNDARIKVGYLLRVKTCLSNWKRIAQHFLKWFALRVHACTAWKHQTGHQQNLKNLEFHSN